MADEVAFMLGVVANARSVSAGVTQLLELGARVRPGPLWRKLARIDFASDARAIERGLRRSLQGARIPARYRGFYCGLDALNMPSGKGIELGCSTTWRARMPVDDTEWATDCDLYPERIPAAAHARFYEATEDHLADLLIGVGYAGLALRRAFSRVVPELLLGGARSRAVCWGHHDGDLWSLGVIEADGFHPTARDRQQLPPRTRRPRPAPLPEAPTLEALARALIAQLPMEDRGYMADRLDAIPAIIAEREESARDSLEQSRKRGGTDAQLIDAWQAGRIAEYRELLATRMTPRSDGHHDMLGLELGQRVIALLGDRDGVVAAHTAGQRLLERSQQARDWTWVRVAMLGSLARIARRAGLGAAARTWRLEAERLAPTVKPPFANTARLSIQRLSEELGEEEVQFDELRARLAAERDPVERAKRATSAAIAAAKL